MQLSHDFLKPSHQVRVCVMECKLITHKCSVNDIHGFEQLAILAICFESLYSLAIIIVPSDHSIVQNKVE